MAYYRYEVIEVVQRRSTRAVVADRKRSPSCANNAICGFANAQGGRLEIGKDTDGIVIGLDNVQKPLDDLPNTIKATMGIIPDVNLHLETGMPYVSIDILPYPNCVFQKRHD